MTAIQIGNFEGRRCTKCEQPFYNDSEILVCSSGHTLTHTRCTINPTTKCQVCDHAMKPLSAVKQKLIHCGLCSRKVFSDEALASCNRLHVIYHEHCLTKAGQTLCGVRNCGNPEILSNPIDLEKHMRLPPDTSSSSTRPDSDKSSERKLGPTAPIPFPRYNTAGLLRSFLISLPVMLIFCVIVENYSWDSLVDYSSVFQSIANCERNTPQSFAQVQSYYYSHFDNAKLANAVLIDSLRDSNQTCYVGALKVLQFESPVNKVLRAKQRDNIRRAVIDRLADESLTEQAKIQTIVTYLTLSTTPKAIRLVFKELTDSGQKHVIKSLALLDAFKPEHWGIMLDLKSFDPNSFVGTLIKTKLKYTTLPKSDIQSDLNADVLAYLLKSKIEAVVFRDTSRSFNISDSKALQARSTNQLFEWIEKDVTIKRQVTDKLTSDLSFVHHVFFVTEASGFQFNGTDLGDRLTDFLKLYDTEMSREYANAAKLRRELEANAKPTDQFDAALWTDSRLIRFWQSPERSMILQNRSKSSIQDTVDKQLIQHVTALNANQWRDSEALRRLQLFLAKHNVSDFKIENANIRHSDFAYNLIRNHFDAALIQLLGSISDWSGRGQSSQTLRPTEVARILFCCKTEQHFKTFDYIYQAFVNSRVFSTGSLLLFDEEILKLSKSHPSIAKRVVSAMANRTQSLYWIALLGSFGDAALKQQLQYPNISKILIPPHLCRNSRFSIEFLVKLLDNNNLEANHVHGHTIRDELSRILTKNKDFWNKLYRLPNNKPGSQYSRNIEYLNRLAKL